MGQPVFATGELLWDLFPDSERLGGATFNFAAHLTRLGHDVLLSTGLGRDDRGDRAFDLARSLGVRTDFIERNGAPTGVVSVRLDRDGKPAFGLHRPAAYDRIEVGPLLEAGIAASRPRWFYFGTLHQFDSGIRTITNRLLGALPDAVRFYDVNLRPDAYTDELVLDLLSKAAVVKLSDEEADELSRMMGEQPGGIERFCRSVAGRFGSSTVCVTRGARGCALWHRGEYLEAPGYAITVADTVGAGDAFAAGLLHGLDSEWSPACTADFANRLGAIVASRRGAVPPWTLDEIYSLP